MARRRTSALRPSGWRRVASGILRLRGVRCGAHIWDCRRLMHDETTSMRQSLQSESDSLHSTQLQVRRSYLMSASLVMDLLTP
ncbi:hypothetical protein OH76DRAFT_1406699 [Lentinus brumalis]|uniref:Uncharacterized protein n=1 Tax=Lentinus brumalis TaxID=2498619 RepID=A0A371D271_9APHY|nr:hypothetical protein OH76DRAFT_1406699 [Polyporus brumalis]